MLEILPRKDEGKGANSNLIPIFEFGGTGAILEDLPMAVGEARTFHKALAASGICDIMETATRGFVDYGFLGGAQIDPYGNLNSTVIGQHHPPKVRLPGSGGANDVGSLCWQTIIIIRHSRRSFVPKCDFVTTPGYLTGPGAREEAGLPPEMLDTMEQVFDLLGGPMGVVVVLGVTLVMGLIFSTIGGLIGGAVFKVAAAPPSPPESATPPPPPPVAPGS